MLEKCVFRHDHMSAVVKKLQKSMKDSNSPGVYIQGPMGAGKSIITYLVAQYAKFHLNWLTYTFRIVSDGQIAKAQLLRKDSFSIVSVKRCRTSLLQVNAKSCAIWSIVSQTKVRLVSNFSIRQKTVR